jgi:hypothetical protein
MKNLANIGRPLTVQIHDSQHSSILSSDGENIQLRGLVNLLVLILLTYTFRAAVDSLEKHDLVLVKEVQRFIDSGIWKDPANYQTFAAFLMTSTFAVNSFWIEIMASKNYMSRHFVSMT